MGPLVEQSFRKLDAFMTSVSMGVLAFALTDGKEGHDFMQTGVTALEVELVELEGKSEAFIQALKNYMRGTELAEMMKEALADANNFSAEEIAEIEAFVMPENPTAEEEKGLILMRLTVVTYKLAKLLG